MRTRLLASVLVAGFGVSLAGLVALPIDRAEAAITKRVQKACKRDYKRFCSKYSVGTPELKQCMRSNGKRISRPCIRALVDAGEISRRVLRKMRRRR